MNYEVRQIEFMAAKEHTKKQKRIRRPNMKPDLRYLKNHMREHLLEKENIETEVEDWAFVIQNFDKFFYVCKKVKNAYFTISFIDMKVEKYPIKEETVGCILAKTGEINSTISRINYETFNLSGELLECAKFPDGEFPLGKVFSCLERADMNLHELLCHIQAAIACLKESYGENEKGVKDN